MQTAFSCRKLLNCNSDSAVLDNLPRKQSDSFLVLLTWTQFHFIKATAPVLCFCMDKINDEFNEQTHGINVLPLRKVCYQ